MPVLFFTPGHSSGGMSYENNPSLLDCLSVYSYNTARDEATGGTNVEWWKLSGDDDDDHNGDHRSSLQNHLEGWHLPPSPLPPPPPPPPSSVEPALASYPPPTGPKKCFKRLNFNSNLR